MCEWRQTFKYTNLTCACSWTGDIFKEKSNIHSIYFWHHFQLNISSSALHRTKRYEMYCYNNRRVRMFERRLLLVYQLFRTNSQFYVHNLDCKLLYVRRFRDTCIDLCTNRLRKDWRKSLFKDFESTHEIGSNFNFNTSLSFNMKTETLRKTMNFAKLFEFRYKTKVISTRCTNFYD